jgi:type IV pilus assembly protein PilA
MAQVHYVRRSIWMLVASAILLMILAIAVPKERHMMSRANEMVVVRELQLINTVQVEYKSRFQRFAATLAELGPPVSGKPGPRAANLIPAALTSGNRDGYQFLMAATRSGYTVNANPKVFKTSGYRTFYTDQNGVIRQNWSAEPANASSLELK